MNAPTQPSRTIRVDVKFYDQAEELKLLAYPTAQAMKSIVAAPLDVPEPEFLTYYLFHRIKLNSPRYRNYETVGQQVNKFREAIADTIEYSMGSVRTRVDVDRQLNEVSEHVGEAIGLSVISRIHGLTKADWQPIPEQRGRSAIRSFDFQIACDGRHFVQVETKGSSVDDNQVLTNAVRNHKRGIDKKKLSLAELAKVGQDPNPAGVRYGTITVIDKRTDGNVRCLLTDPPAGALDERPEKARLLSRMRYLRDLIGFINPRAPLAAALATRVADLDALSDPFELNRRQLVRGNGDPFEIVPYSGMLRRHSTFLATKSRVLDGPAGGVVVQLSHKALFFIGIQEELLLLAVNQDFAALIDYKSKVGVLKKKIECTFSVSRYRRLDLPVEMRMSARKKGGYFHIVLSGELHYNSAGMVFGVIPIPDEWPGIRSEISVGIDP